MMVAASGTPVCLLTSSGADKAGRARATSESRVVNFIVQGKRREKKERRGKRMGFRTLQAVELVNKVFLRKRPGCAGLCGWESTQSKKRKER